MPAEIRSTRPIYFDKECYIDKRIRHALEAVMSPFMQAAPSSVDPILSIIMCFVIDHSADWLYKLVVEQHLDTISSDMIHFSPKRILSGFLLHFNENPECVYLEETIFDESVFEFGAIWGTVTRAWIWGHITAPEQVQLIELKRTAPSNRVFYVYFFRLIGVPPYINRLSTVQLPGVINWSFEKFNRELRWFPKNQINSKVLERYHLWKACEMHQKTL